MTVNEYVAVLPESVTISIGMKSGYVFIGSKAEYEQFIDRLSREALDIVEDFYGKYARQAENIRAAKARSADGLLDTRLHEVTARRDLFGKRVKNFKPFRQREVKEIYERLDPPDGIVIICEGCEEGRYWVRGEFEQYIKRWLK